MEVPGGLKDSPGEGGSEGLGSGSPPASEELNVTFLTHQSSKYVERKAPWF